MAKKKKKKEKEAKPTIASQEREIRRLKAEVRKSKRLVRTAEKESDIVGRILAVVKDSMDSMPAIKIPKFKVKKNGENEEVAVILISDVHVGKKTKSYNHKEFIVRLGVLEKGILSVVTAHRSIRPVRKLVVVFNGDVIDAESIYPSQAIDHISLKLIDQIFSYAVPKFTEFLGFCAENFEEVVVYGNKGNHGRLNASKWSSSRSTNWEFVFLKALEMATRNVSNIEWHIDTKDWKSLFRVQGHGFLATHGDMIRMYYSTPIYGMTRQSMRWANAYQRKIKLSYFLFGHFHSAGSFRFNHVNIIMNGSFVSNCPYAEEHLGVASVPEMMLFGVHRKFGVTWRYPLRLA